MLAPVIIFVYNRPDHIRQTIESLRKNPLAKESDLFIFSDAAKDKNDEKKVEEVRSLIHGIVGFQQIAIIERQHNMGLANSIIAGVSDIIKRYGKAIVLEDDLVVTDDFLQFMNDALSKYTTYKEIFSVSGYCIPISMPSDFKDDVFLFHRINSWGWATWADRWETVDWEVSDFKYFMKNRKARNLFNRGGEGCDIDLLKQMKGETNSWAIRFNYACYKNDAFTVYPVRSKVQNKGVDGSGTHVKKTEKYDTDLNNSPIKVIEKPVFQPEIGNQIRFVYKKSTIRKMINFYKYWKYRFGF